MSSFTARTMSLDDDDEESEDGSPRPNPPPAPPGEEDKGADFAKYAEAYYTTLNVSSELVRRGQSALARTLANFEAFAGHSTIATHLHPPSTTLSRLSRSVTGPPLCESGQHDKRRGRRQRRARSRRSLEASIAGGTPLAGWRGGCSAEIERRCSQAGEGGLGGVRGSVGW